jgi:hypothetical protein
MKFKTDDLESCFSCEDNEKFELVEEAEFVDDGKYSHGQFVFLNKEDNKHYSCQVARCGSYFDDYSFYFEEECDEVEQRTVMVKKWMPIDKKPEAVAISSVLS